MQSTLRQDIGLLLLRLGVSVLMLLNHGLPKFDKYFYGDPTKFSDPLGVGNENSLLLAIFAELCCSIFLILGLFTRWAAFFLIFTMAVAAFIVHSGDPFKQIEKALLFLLVYLVIWLLGPGKYSLDVQWLKKTY